MKKACVHELLAGRTLDRLSHVRREEVVRLVVSMGQSAAEGKPVDVDAALMGLTGDIVSRMVMSRRWTGDDNDTEEMRSVVAETAVVTGTFNLQDYIGVFKNWDVQGLGKRIDAVHRKFDAMMEKILTARDAKRRQQRESADSEDGGEGEAKDILDVLFDMHEDDAAEMPLSRDNIKAFMLVASSNAGVELLVTDTVGVPLVNFAHVHQDEKEWIKAHDRRHAGARSFRQMCAPPHLVDDNVRHWELPELEAALATVGCSGGSTGLGRGGADGKGGARAYSSVGIFLL
uniref:Cytochrome P450 93A2 n=1 Tax=Aegilops tauschii TaxID=37682 RepID=N1QXU9_AEGTA